MEIRCRTNLDLVHEEWPEELESAPLVGDLIESRVQWPQGNFRLALKVIDRRWQYSEFYRKWVLCVELHVPNGENLREFFQWYAPKVGRNVSDFI